MRVEDMKTKLIMFYGPGSGAGKSLLATQTSQALKRHGFRVRHIAENDVLNMDAFAPYVREVESGRADNVTTLLSACQRFIQECEDSSHVYVLDSILPCSDWLVTAQVFPEGIRCFTAHLIELLQNLESTLVFISGDIEIFLARAIEDRGKEWARSLARKRCDSEDPDDLLTYFDEMRKVAVEIVENWPYRKLKVDTASTDIDTCRKAVLQFLKI